MNIRNHKLWKLLKQKALTQNPDTAAEFEVDVWRICEFGIELSKTVRDTFPTYTLHDEIHINNVLDNMLELLGNRRDELTRDECAMLLMAACCHDIGMSATEKEKKYLKSCPDCMQVYLLHHPDDYVVAYPYNLNHKAVITDEILQHYIRTNHHKRIYEQLQKIDWPKSLGRSISMDELIAVCQSHGENADSLVLLQSKYSSLELDLCLCAVLLRIGDILDFDITRAPDALYRYIGLEWSKNTENKKSRLEWQKHLSSSGFTFKQNNQRTLLYRANCNNPQVEKAVTAYLDWVDEELTTCAKLIRFMETRWHSLTLPGKIERRITATGYLSGEYKFTLDQKQMIRFLMEHESGHNPTRFVRELIKNAIDAIHIRIQLDKNLPLEWRPQINISTWTEGEYSWFRIEDNGIGMTEQIIRDFFLKIGSSYYTSKQFAIDSSPLRDRLSRESVGRYGIGILSCFISDPENNCLELTTKHFNDGKEPYPAYRLSIHGINGYYTLSNDIAHREMTVKMPDRQGKGQRFIQNPGTIIAVRMNLYQSGSTRNFKDIIQSCIVYPDIPIHYDGPDGSCDYKTYQEFIKAIPHSETEMFQPVGSISISEEQFQRLQEAYPQVIWEERPHIVGYCLPLEHFSDIPLIKGVSFIAKAEGKGTWQTEENGKKDTINVRLSLQATSLYKRPDVWMKICNLPDRSTKNTYAQPFEESGHYIGPFFNLMDRKEFPHYQTWFSQKFRSNILFRSERNRFVNGGNGIYSGNKLLLPFMDTIISDTIFILDSQECRSKTDFSQDFLEYLNLEIICHLDAIANRIQSRLNIKNDPELTLFNHTYYHHYFDTSLKPLKDYWEVAKHDPMLMCGKVTQ